MPLIRNFLVRRYELCGLSNSVHSFWYNLCNLCRASSLFNDSASASCAEGVLAALVASGDLKSGITADAKLGLTPVTLTTFQITYNPYSKSERVKYATAVEIQESTQQPRTVVGTTAACPNTRQLPIRVLNCNCYLKPLE